MIFWGKWLQIHATARFFNLAGFYKATTSNETVKKIFLDVGGHRGQTLEVVLSSKCQFDLVHCFEPIPELYEHIKTTFSADISTGKLLVHNFGLANFTDERKLYGTGQQAHFGDGIGASLFADKCDIDNRHFH